MSLPIFEGYPHSTSVQRMGGIERVLDYHPDTMPVPDLTYATEFVTQCQGVYLKWLNRSAGYKYWLFSNVVINKSKTSSLKYINNNSTQRINKLNRRHELGKTNTPSIECYSRIKSEYIKIVEGILYSPEVYLYTDKLPVELSIANCGWVKVEVKPGTFTIRNSKNNSEELRLRIDLPQYYIQTLI